MPDPVLTPPPWKAVVDVDRMEKMIAFLEGLLPKEFYFGKVVAKDDIDGCGTVCCVIGWTPKVFPELCRWTPGKDDVYAVNDKHYSKVASKLFCLTPYVADHLFSPNNQEYVHKRLPRIPSMAGPEEVAAMLRLFLKYVGEERIRNHSLSRPLNG